MIKRIDQFLLRKLNIGRLLLYPTAVFLVSLITLYGGYQYMEAASTSTFTQVISASTLATDIRSDSTTSVSSPAVSLSSQTFSFNCQTSTGTFGTNGERIYVDNPDGADNGWTLTVAASPAATAVWNQGSNYFDFNDAGGSGCTDGADADSYGGQLTINANAGTITTDYSGSDTTGLTKGTSTAFAQGTTDSITLITAANTSADIWRGYITGISLSQTIPAEQAAASYTINFALTATAS